MADELKTCPFCGGEADVYNNANETYSVGAFGACRFVNPTLYRCYCKRCGATGETVQVDKGGETNVKILQ